MAGARSISDTSVAQPNKSLSNEHLDAVLVPDLAISQAPGQGSTLCGHGPITSTALLNVTHEIKH